MFSMCLMRDETLEVQIVKNRVQDQEHRDARFFDEANTLLKTWNPEELNAIAVSIGPGMFTSLRVGLSLAKGIAFAHGTPVVAVNSLDVMGQDYAYFPGPVSVVVNAFHKEMYIALYDRGKRISDHMLVHLNDLAAIQKQAMMVIGPGVQLLQDQGYLSVPGSKDVLDNRVLFPSAEMVVISALHRIKNRDFVAIETLEPYYIKKTDAERLHDQKNVS